MRIAHLQHRTIKGLCPPQRPVLPQRQIRGER